VIDDYEAQIVNAHPVLLMNLFYVSFPAVQYLKSNMKMDVELELERYWRNWPGLILR
jgi:hypothetical protein